MGYLVPGHDGLGLWPDGRVVGTPPPSPPPPSPPPPSPPPATPPPCIVDEPTDDAVATDADLERVAKNLKKLKYKRLVAVAKKVGVKQAVAPGVKKTGKQLAEEVSKVLNA